MVSSLILSYNLTRDLSFILTSDKERIDDCFFSSIYPVIRSSKRFVWYLEMVLEIVTVCESPFFLYWLDFLDYLLKLLMLLNICRVQGGRWNFTDDMNLLFFWLRKLDSVERLTLIVSDPRISAALLILSVSKMVLIYLNYRLWSIKLKVIYAKVLDTLVLERNGNVPRLNGWTKLQFSSQ